MRKKLFYRKPFLRGLGIGLSVFILCISIIFYWKIDQWAKKQSITLSSLFITALASNEDKVKTDTQGNTTFLLLGIGGGNHEGSDLTDVIMYAQYQWKTGKVSLISIPRDVWSPSMQDKINTAYHYGLLEGNGIERAIKELNSLFALSPQYTVVIDFSTFVSFIDAIGGITVPITVAFTDSLYPIAGKEKDTCGGDPQFRCRYEHLSFQVGMTLMDGETALKYVRSRHAEGDEGTDFARSRRQQEVLLAIRKKLISLPPFTLVHVISVLYTNILPKIQFTGTITDYLSLIRMYSHHPKISEIRSISVDKVFMMGTMALYQNRYVLIPVTSFEDVQAYLLQKLQ